MEAEAISGIRGRFRIREKLCRIQADPRKVSAGYALGVFLGTTPFIGTKVFISLLLTSVFRWNKISSIIGVYHINILTAPLFYSLSFLVGRWILGVNATFSFPESVSFSAMAEAFLGNSEIFFSLLTGGLILGIPMAASAYLFSMKVLGGRTNDKHPASSIQHPVSSINYTLITGASSGLGRELAIECASRGMNVILVALPGRNLDVLSDLLEKEYGITARFYERDLTCRQEIQEMVDEILKKYTVNFLINNAGTGGTVPFEESSVDYLERIIRLNITAVSLLTRLLVPELKKHPGACILNVSSMAAFSPIPFKTIYPASKAFVAHFSRSLGEELKGTSVKVSVLHPGPILTNPDVVIRIIRQGNNGKRGLLPARELARIAIDEASKGRRVIVPGMANKMNRMLMQLMPSDIVLPFLSKTIAKELTENHSIAA